MKKCKQYQNAQQRSPTSPSQDRPIPTRPENTATFATSQVTSDVTAATALNQRVPVMARTLIDQVTHPIELLPRRFKLHPLSKSKMSRIL